MHLLFGDWQQQSGIPVRKEYDELQILEQVLAAAVDIGFPWDYAYFVKYPLDHLDGNSTEYRSSELLFRDIRRTGSSVVIELPSSWDDYIKSLSSSQRRRIARRVNGMNRAGTVRYERLELNSAADEAKMQKLMDDAVGVS